VSLDAPPGTSNPRMTQIATALGRKLRALPGVDQVGAHIGRAKTGDQLVNVNSGELWVSLEPDADHDRTLASIEAVVDRARGVDHDVTTYTAERIRDVGALREGENAVDGNDIDVLTGSDEPLVVRVYGQDLATLRREARRALRVVSQVDGVENPKLELPVTQPTIEIETDLDRAQRFGVKPGDVRRAEAALIQGIHVGSIFKEQKVFDVIVRGVPATRRSVASVRNLLLDRPGGGHVRLGEVADVRVGQTPVSIERDAVSRRLDIEAGVSGRSLDAVAGDVEDRLASMRFPLEYHAEVLKRTASDEIDATRMVVVAIAAAIAAFLLLQAAFRSWSVAALVFLALPLSLVGGLAVALVSGAELSLGSLLGLLAVLVLATRAGLVLIRHMQDLAPESGRFGTGLVERGAQERLRPILTSAAAVAAVMLPFAVAGSPPGLEVVHPMATVVLGGLVTSTLVSLFVLPALYLRFGGRQPTLSPEEELMQRWADVHPAEEPVERAPLA
jgi:Cu/Ag efflux pump CusA